MLPVARLVPCPPRGIGRSGIRCDGFRCAPGAQAALATLFAASLLAAAGCGTTKAYEATEQRLLSQAADRSVSDIDFRPLSGMRVYLDPTYLRSRPGQQQLVNAEYVTSALRQQIVTAGCLLQDSLPEADIVIEARIGTLGADNHQVTYGIPANSALSSAASLVTQSPVLPPFPEISFARRETREGAVKVAAFAYDRESRLAVWQSGTIEATSSARDTWLLGVGPFQAGSIRKRGRLLGTTLALSEKEEGRSPPGIYERPPVNFAAQVRFLDGWPIVGPDHPGMPPGKLTPSNPVATIAAKEGTSEGAAEGTGEGAAEAAAPTEAAGEAEPAAAAGATSGEPQRLPAPSAP